MQVAITQVFVLAAVIVTSRAQLTNIVGATSVSVSPTDATCGQTFPDNYCQGDVAAEAGCVLATCRAVCEDVARYTDLLRNATGFNYDDSVTNTTKDFGGGDITVAEFKNATPMAFLEHRVNMTTMNEFTISFWIKPDDMDKER